MCTIRHAKATASTGDPKENMALIWESIQKHYGLAKVPNEYSIIRVSMLSCVPNVLFTFPAKLVDVVVPKSIV